MIELDKFKCQVFLNSIAQRGFSFTVVDHCRTILKAILEEAVDAELMGKNPARKLVNPETKEPEKHVLPKVDARALLTSLPIRDRLIAMIAAFCAMRPVPHGQPISTSTWRASFAIVASMNSLSSTASATEAGFHAPMPSPRIACLKRTTHSRSSRAGVCATTCVTE